MDVMSHTGASGGSYGSYSNLRFLWARRKRGRIEFSSGKSLFRYFIPQLLKGFQHMLEFYTRVPGELVIQHSAHNVTEMCYFPLHLRPRLDGRQRLVPRPFRHCSLATVFLIRLGGGLWGRAATREFVLFPVGLHETTRSTENGAASSEARAHGGTEFWGDCWNRRTTKTAYRGTARGRTASWNAWGWPTPDWDTCRGCHGAAP